MCREESAAGRIACEQVYSLGCEEAPLSRTLVLRRSVWVMIIWPFDALGRESRGREETEGDEIAGDLGGITLSSKGTAARHGKGTVVG